MSYPTSHHTGVCFECSRSVTVDEQSILLHDACHDKVLEGKIDLRAENARLAGLIREWREGRARLGTAMTFVDKNLIDGVRSLEAERRVPKTTYAYRPYCQTCAGIGKVPKPCDDPNCTDNGCAAGGMVLCPDCREF